MTVGNTRVTSQESLTCLFIAKQKGFGKYPTMTNQVAPTQTMVAKSLAAEAEDTEVIGEAADIQAVQRGSEMTNFASKMRHQHSQVQYLRNSVHLMTPWQN